MKIKAKDFDRIRKRFEKSQKSIIEGDYMLEAGGIKAVEHALHYNYEAKAILMDNEEHLRDVLNKMRNKQ